MLLYVGDGPQLAELRALHSTLDARAQIVLVCYRPDVGEILDEADVCVVPSVWQEAFCLSVAEPMARGIPVVASCVGAIPEMIEHGVSGLPVPPGDEHALADAIAGLLEDPERAALLGAAGRTRIAERFTPEQQLRKLARLVDAGFDAPGAM